MAHSEDKNKETSNWQLDVSIYLSSNPKVKNVYEPEASPEIWTFIQEHGIQLWARYGQPGEKPTEIELRGSYADVKKFVANFLSGDGGDEFGTVEQAQLVADKGQKVWVLFPRNTGLVHPTI